MAGLARLIVCHRGGFPGGRRTGGMGGLTGRAADDPAPLAGLPPPPRRPRSARSEPGRAPMTRIGRVVSFPAKTNPCPHRANSPDEEVLIVAVTPDSPTPPLAVRVPVRWRGRTRRVRRTCGGSTRACEPTSTDAAGRSGRHDGQRCTRVKNSVTTVAASMSSMPHSDRWGR